jgi:hypothetical protein
VWRTAQVFKIFTHTTVFCNIPVFVYVLSFSYIGYIIYSGRMLCGLNAIHPVVSPWRPTSRDSAAQRIEVNLKGVQAPGTNLETSPALGEHLVAQHTAM